MRVRQVTDTTGRAVPASRTATPREQSVNYCCACGSLLAGVLLSQPHAVQAAKAWLERHHGPGHAPIGWAAWRERYRVRLATKA